MKKKKTPCIWMFSPPHCRASQLPHQSKPKLSQRYTFSSRLSAWVGVSSSVYALIASILIRVISLENGADNIHPLFNSGSKENYPAQHLSGTNQHQPWHWMIFAVTENGQSHLLLLVFLCGETSQPVLVYTSSSPAFFTCKPWDLFCSCPA